MRCYVHNVPGRLRVRVPAVKGNATEAATLVSRLNTLKGVDSVVANALTGSILIRYDTTAIDADACLAVLNVQPAQPTVHPPNGVATRIAEAVTWYLLEKALERCCPLLLAVLM